MKSPDINLSADGNSPNIESPISAEATAPEAESTVSLDDLPKEGSYTLMWVPAELLDQAQRVIDSREQEIDAAARQRVKTESELAQTERQLRSLLEIFKVVNFILAARNISPDDIRKIRELIRESIASLDLSDINE